MMLPKRALDGIARVQKGQTMTEYVLLASAVAIFVFAAYQKLATLGIVQSLVGTIDTYL